MIGIYLLYKTNTSWFYFLCSDHLFSKIKSIKFNVIIDMIGSRSIIFLLLSFEITKCNAFIYFFNSESIILQFVLVFCFCQVNPLFACAPSFPSLGPPSTSLHPCSRSSQSTKLVPCGLSASPSVLRGSVYNNKRNNAFYSVLLPLEIHKDRATGRPPLVVGLLSRTDY